MSCYETTLITYRNSDQLITYLFPAGYSLTGYAPEFMFRAEPGAAPILTVSSVASANGSKAEIVDSTVVLTLKRADLEAFPSMDAWDGYYDSTLTKDSFVNRFVGGPMTQFADGSYGDQDGTGLVSLDLSGQTVSVSIQGGNIGIGASVLLADLNAAVETATDAAATATAATMFLAPGTGASSVTFASYLRNKLQIGSFGGLLGSISASRAQNTLAYNQLYAAVVASGRGVGDLPKNEILLNPGFIHSSPSVKMQGSGGTETILNFGASAVDCITINASINATLQGIGFIAPGATAGSIVKVTGTQTPSLMDLHFFGGFNLLEITGGAGGVNIENIDAGAYTNFGVYLHDNVQGVNWRGGNLNAGSLLTGVGIRSVGFVSSVRVTDVEILTGLRGIHATGTLGDATGLCYSEFKGVYCDGNAQANIINASRDVEWIGGWFSAGRELVSGSYDHCLSVSGNQNLTFSGTRFKNGGKNGFQHLADNVGVSLMGCSATNNGQNIANARGFSFEAGSNKFQLIGGFSNNTSYSSGQQAYGVVLDTCNNAAVVGHYATGSVAGILNTTPGANLYITSCPGTANYP